MRSARGMGRAYYLWRPSWLAVPSLCVIRMPVTERRTHLAKRAVAIVTAVVCALAGAFGQVSSVAAQAAPFVCNEMLGFSETQEWYDAGFHPSIPNPGS